LWIPEDRIVQPPTQEKIIATNSQEENTSSRQDPISNQQDTQDHKLHNQEHNQQDNQILIFSAKVMASPDHILVIDSLHSFTIKDFIETVGKDNERLYVYVAKVIEIVQNNPRLPLKEAIEKTKKLYGL